MNRFGHFKLSLIYVADMLSGVFDLFSVSSVEFKIAVALTSWYGEVERHAWMTLVVDPRTGEYELIEFGGDTVQLRRLQEAVAKAYQFSKINFEYFEK